MSWTAADLPSFAGRTVIVTGANSGLGLVTARELARVGAHVVLACRNTGKGDEAAATMTGDVEVRKLDLQDLASIREFAGGVDSVDVLINNAGIMAVPYALTKDGFESQIGTNHLGHFALTNLLLPKVTDRVVTVSSFMHLLGKISLKDLNWKARPYSAWLAYGQSKLANLLFTSELQKRLDAAGLVADVPGRPPRLLGDQPAGPHRQPDRHPVLGRRKQPVRHQRRLRRPPDAVRGVGGPARQHASSGRSSRCAGRRVRRRAARWPATATPPGHCGSCPSSSRRPNFRSELLVGYPWGRVTARVVRPPLSTRLRVSDLVPAFAVRMTHDRQHRSTEHGQRRHRQQAQRHRAHQDRQGCLAASAP